MSSEEAEQQVVETQQPATEATEEQQNTETAPENVQENVVPENNQEESKQESAQEQPEQKQESQPEPEQIQAPEPTPAPAQEESKPEETAPAPVEEVKQEQPAVESAPAPEPEPVKEEPAPQQTQVAETITPAATSVQSTSPTPAQAPEPAPAVEETKTTAPVAQSTPAPVEVKQAEASSSASTTTTTAKPAAVAIPMKTTNERKFPKIAAQSVAVEGGARRRVGYENALVVRRFEDLQTAYDSFKQAATRYPSKPCLGVRKIDPQTKAAGAFVFQTYKEIYQRVKNVAAGLIHLGVKPSQHVGIYSKNRPEWQIAAEACHVQSLVSIALYDTLGEESSLYIMNHGEIRALFLAGDVVANAIKFVGKSEYLKNFISFDPLSEEQRKQLAAANPNITIHSIDEIEALGAKNPTEDCKPQPDSLATIMYTSGTTGMPKGVMLTHRNIIAAVSGFMLSVFEMNADDCLLSFLPLAHILERVAEFALLQSGASIGYWQGNIKLLSEDIKTLRPTVLAVVPRVLDRMYDGIRSRIEKTTGVKKFLFQKAYESKRAAMRAIPPQPTPIWDALVFATFKTNTGGRMRGMLSGGAPLRPEVQEFLTTCFGVPICQGYGLTETTAAASIQLPIDFSTAHVGAPLPSNEIKLVDVPEMNYLSTNDPPSGEICIRGPSISLGYFKEPEKTAEVFDADGWFHTGDVGRWNKNGTLSIFDRIKNIFKLSQGEYVAAEALELKLALAPFISQIWIYGDSLKSSLVAVAVVEPIQTSAFAKEKGITTTDIDEIIKQKIVKDEIMAQITKAGKDGKLKGYEFPRKVHLVSKEFLAYDAVTPSMKLKRNVLKTIFQTEINSMYAEVDKEDASKQEK